MSKTPFISDYIFPLLHVRRRLTAQRFAHRHVWVTLAFECYISAGVQVSPQENALAVIPAIFWAAKLHMSDNRAEINNVSTQKAISHVS